MGKRQQVTTTRTYSELPDEEEERRRQPAQVEHIPPSEAELTWAAFSGKFMKAGARVKVYRRTERGRQYVFFDTPDRIDDEIIRQFHARQPYAAEPGDYELCLEVNGEMMDPFPVSIAPQVAATAAAGPQAVGGQFGEVLRLLQAQNERLEARLMAQERTPMSEMLQCIVQLDALRGQKETNIETLTKAIELGKSLAGGGGTTDADFWKSIIAEAAPHVAPIIANMLSKNGGMPPGLPPPQQVPVGGVQVNDATEQMIFRQVLGGMKKKALAGSDPLLYVDVVMDNQEEPLYGRLIQRIVEQDFSTFTALDPDIANPPYHSFFRAIYDGIRQQFIPADSVAATPARAAGDSGDVNNNGTHGEKGGSKS